MNEKERSCIINRRHETDEISRLMTRAFSPALSKATPMRLSYMERAYNWAVFTGRTTSVLKEWPPFTVTRN